MKEVKSLEYQENKQWIQEYFSALFFFEEKNVVDILKRFGNKKGYFIDDYLACWFTSELSDKKDQGTEGVIFDFSVPLVPENCTIFLTYQEFFAVVKEWYEKYVVSHTKQGDEVRKLLECLKTQLKV